MVELYFCQYFNTETSSISYSMPLYIRLVLELKTINLVSILFYFIFILFPFISSYFFLKSKRQRRQSVTPSQVT